MKKIDLEKVENYLYTKARDVEVAIYNYFFNNFEREYVSYAISMYQNSDGGFSNALNPNILDPNSNVACTYFALDSLYKVGFNKDNIDEVTYSIVQKSYRYLFNKVEMVEGKFKLANKSSLDFPHASDLNYNNKITYNPTAALIGYALCFFNNSSKYHKKALHMVDAAVKEYLNDFTLDKDVIISFERLYECLLYNGIDNKELFNKIINDINLIVERDKSKWGNENVVAPLDLLGNKIYQVTPELKEVVKKHKEYLLDSTNHLGIWNLAYKWHTNYEEEEMALIIDMSIYAINNLINLREN